MKSATVHELKKELETYHPDKIRALILRLVKYKKDNKELLTYLLFEAQDEEAYVQSIKNEVDDMMDNINRNTIYWTKKGLRKVLRYLDKFIRYSGNKETETNLRIYFCEQMKERKIPFKRSKVLQNLFDRQVDKIEKALGKLHEDLQYDYSELLRDIKA